MENWLCSHFLFFFFFGVEELGVERGESGWVVAAKLWVSR